MITLESVKNGDVLSLEEYKEFKIHCKTRWDYVLSQSPFENKRGLDIRYFVCEGSGFNVKIKEGYSVVEFKVEFKLFESIADII